MIRNNVDVYRYYIHINNKRRGIKCRDDCIFCDIEDKNKKCDYNTKLITYMNGEQQLVLYGQVIKRGYKVGEKKKKRDLKKLAREELKRNDELSMFKIADLKREYDNNIKQSGNRAKNKIYQLSRANNWEYFITLTFDKRFVDRYNYDECVKKLKVWIMNIKRLYAKDLKYIVVPELHKDGAFHFHGLLADIGDMELKDSGKRLKSGGVIYNIVGYKLGFTTATKVINSGASARYLSKYITKDLSMHIKNKKKYWASRNLNKPIINERLLTKKQQESIKKNNEEYVQSYKKLKVDDEEHRLYGAVIEYIELKDAKI